MTTEILRNLLYKVGTATEHLGLTAALSMDRVGCVVFDECHYINDRDRGAVWEESMMLLPAAVRMVLLSATLDRPDAFAAWLGDLKKTPCALIQTAYRVVPLTHYVMNQVTNELIPIMDSKEKFNAEAYKAWIRDQKKAVHDKDKYRERVKDARAAGVEGAIDGKVTINSFVHTLNQSLKQLNEKELLPAVCFVFSRKDCERYAAAVEGSLYASSIVKDEGNPLVPHYKNGILVFEKAVIGKEYKGVETQRVFDFHLRHHKKSLETLPVYHTLRELVGRGMGFHHSGLLPVLKEVLELLYADGYLKLLFCTETFAVGLNMPTKTVLFTGLRKYSDDCDGMRLLRHDEYMQMAGRAGRRGKDTVGYVIYLPDRAPVEWTDVQAVLRGALPALESSMRFGYDFLLKVVNQGASWRELMERSYWYRCHAAALAEAELERDRIWAESVGGRPAAELMPDLEALDTWTQAGRGASNAEKKALQRKIEDWRNKHLGPRWAAAQETYAAYKKTLWRHERAVEKCAVLAGYAKPVEATWDFLVEQGYISTDGTLTRKGQAASECNESHSLLMTALFYSGKLEGLSVEEIIGVCAAFVEGGKAEGAPRLMDVSSHPVLRDAFEVLESVRLEFMQSERQHGLVVDEDYWKIHTTMIEPLMEWVAVAISNSAVAIGDPAVAIGDSAVEQVHISSLCADYGIFEGNFVRSVLKTANVLDELVAVATLESATALLEKLEGARARLVRDLVVPDSLYLHL